VTLFGKNQRFLTPISVNAGAQILINGGGGDEITVSKFAVGEPDQKRVVSTNIDEVIRAVVELGGMYPDIVQMFQEAKTTGALTSRFEVDALPEIGRLYRRVIHDPSLGAAEADKGSVEAKPSSPAPDLFDKQTAEDASEEGAKGKNSAANSSSEEKSDEKTPPKKSFFGKIFGFASNKAE
jgi:hypothetical protein